MFDVIAISIAAGIRESKYEEVVPDVFGKGYDIAFGLLGLFFIIVPIFIVISWYYYIKAIKATEVEGSKPKPWYYYCFVTLTHDGNRPSSCYCKSCGCKVEDSKESKLSTANTSSQTTESKLYKWWYSEFINK